MRRIIRRHEVVADDVYYGAEAPLAGQRAVQPLAELIGAGAPAAHGALAVLIGPTDELEPLQPYLGRIDLIVVEFPKLGEGRGFSQARVLRQRHRYQGELRARGVLKRDQLFFLARCGFDSFDLDPAEDLQQSLAALRSFSVAYQDASELVVQVRERAVAP